MDLSVKLQVFEGPLDLLLHLIEKNKVDICDIPINEITEQYLAYVETMSGEDLSAASEFLVMAAELIDIKCRMLLPVDESGEEDTADPRQELVERLTEYKMYKYAAKKLTELETRAELSLYKTPDIPGDVLAYRPRPDLDGLLKGIDLKMLGDIYQSLLKRQADKIDPVGSAFGKIEMEEVSLTEKIDYVRQRALSKGKCSFRQMLLPKHSKMQVIVTFLAVLELVKDGTITVSQKRTFDDISISAAK